MSERARKGIDPHFSSLEHPQRVFLADLFQAIVDCPYKPSPFISSQDNLDARTCFAVQYLVRQKKVFCLDDRRGHMGAAFYRSFACDVTSATDRLGGLVCIGHPEDGHVAQARLRSCYHLVAPDGLLMVFNASAYGVRRAVETFICDLPVPNWYVHRGSGLYLLGEAGYGKVLSLP
jgi:hypothetical protein